MTTGHERALVLGGGGLAGIAWLYGMLAGLAERGVDPGRADLVLGTSAGASVGANVAAGRDLEERYAAQLAPATGEIAASTGAGLALRVLRAAVSGRRVAQDVRARIGRLALDAATVDESERLAAVASRLGDLDWSPDTDLRVTVVDAHTAPLAAGLDPAARPPAARAGRRQSADVVDAVRAVWD